MNKYNLQYLMQILLQNNNITKRISNTGILRPVVD